MKKELDADYQSVQSMTDVKEIPLDELVKEAVDRSIKANGELIIAIFNAMKKGGEANNPELDKACQEKQKNELRLHAVRAELIARGVDWIDAYNFSQVSQLNA